MFSTTKSVTGKKLTLVKWPGSKSYIRPWLYEHFPDFSQYRRYFEPCAGSASVILGKTGHHAEEILVEKDPHQHNLLRVVSDRRLFPKFHRQAKMLRSDERTFEAGRERIETTTFGSEIDWAISQYAARRLSRNGEGKRYGRSEDRDVQGCLTRAVGMLPLVHRRLRNTTLIRGDCLELLPSLASHDSFAYIDPPYMASTRSAFKLYGENEWSDDDHARLLGMVTTLPGKILISGYRSALYEVLLGSWRVESKKFSLRARHSRYDVRRLYKDEYLWANY